MKLGPLELRHPTLLAPMEGVTNARYRCLASETAPIGMVCTEFVRVSGHHLHASRVRKAVLKQRGVPLSVQLMGRDPEKMADAAAKLVDAGSDAIDLNIGCPSKLATRAGVGAAMLKDPVVLARVVRAIRPRVPVLSAKMRAGFDHRDQGEEVLRVLEDEGVDFITVHPRRRVDQYKGSADWRVIDRFRELTTLPIVGNGDLWHADDALEALRSGRCDAVMIGRPALRNPWIFRQIAEGLHGVRPREVEMQELLTFIAQCVERYEAAAGRRAIGPLKELGRWWTRGLVDGGAALRRRMLRTQNIPDFHQTLREGLLAAGQESLDLGVAPKAPTHAFEPGLGLGDTEGHASDRRILSQGPARAT